MRYCAASEFPRVVRELCIPCATPVRITGMVACPRHQEPFGKSSRMCVRCHHEASDEVGRRYASPDRNEPTKGEEKIVSEVIPEPVPGTELDIPDQPTAPVPGLFGTAEPTLVVERVKTISQELARVIESQHLYVTISGKKHIKVEGWTLLGSMLGVFPITTWSSRLEDGWEARVEARTLDGRLVGAAESECLRSESKWARKDDYAIRSMAQTRATSKALKMPLGFVLSMAGYDTTPAEEIIEQEATTAAPPAPSAPSDEQKERISTLIGELQSRDEELGKESRDWGTWCRDYAGVDSFNELDEAEAARLVNGLERALAQRGEPEATA